VVRFFGAEAVIEFWWSVALATLGVVVPANAALYEFVIKGRKRLGYRVQMDTTATDVVKTADAGALEQLQRDGQRLKDPTLVLLRIENNGATAIDTRDYAVLDDKVGIRVAFPGRKVAGMVSRRPRRRPAVRVPAQYRLRAAGLRQGQADAGRLDPFGPILREAAGSYADTCHGASFAFDIRGSGEGLRALNEAKDPATLAFSDGEKPTGYPALLPRPIAFFLFALVANPTRACRTSRRTRSGRSSRAASPTGRRSAAAMCRCGW
jgi:hypothetical protein